MVIDNQTSSSPVTFFLREKPVIEHSQTSLPERHYRERRLSLRLQKPRAAEVVLSVTSAYPKKKDFRKGSFTVFSKLLDLFSDELTDFPDFLSERCERKELCLGY